MKLINLETSLDKSKIVTFNPSGLTVIRGDGENDVKKHGSSNGTGKTLTAELISYCLGTRGILPYVLPEGRVSLTFSINQHEHLIERELTKNNIYFDEKQISYATFIEWLDNSGIVDISCPHISFRSILSRFLRVSLNDSINPLFTEKEDMKPYEAIVRNLWILGLEPQLMVSHIQSKEELDRIEATLKTFQKDTLLKDILASGLDTSISINNLEEQVQKLEYNLTNFEVAKDYHDLERRANDFTCNIRKYEQQISVLEFQIENLQKTIKIKPDINTNDLEQLYSQFKLIFNSNAIKHFKDVETFHIQFNNNRGKRLQQELVKLNSQLNDVNNLLNDSITKRNATTKELQSKRALDEYITVSKLLSEKQAKLASVKQYHDYKQKMESKKVELKQNLLNYHKEAIAYLDTRPLDSKSQDFRTLAAHLYPEKDSGLSIQIHKGNSKSLYDLHVYIESDNADGVNDARIMCYDWVLFTKGSHHNFNFLWHDNRFFADIDPTQRARWIELTMKHSKLLDKQYIITINNENYESIKRLMPIDIQKEFEQSVVVNLKGDKPENKLLGISFDKNRS